MSFRKLSAVAFVRLPRSISSAKNMTSIHPCDHIVFSRTKSGKLLHRLTMVLRSILRTTCFSSLQVQRKLGSKAWIFCQVSALNFGCFSQASGLLKLKSPPSPRGANSTEPEDRHRHSVGWQSMSKIVSAACYRRAHGPSPTNARRQGRPIACAF
jgi:hypothetical protein